MKLPEIDEFHPGADIRDFEHEERKNLLLGNVVQNLEHSEQIDLLICDIIRLRIIEKFIVVLDELRKYNDKKQSLQRWTATFLLLLSGQVDCLYSAQWGGDQSIPLLTFSLP